MRKKTLLVVEDDEDILQLLSYTLTKAGYRVILACSGEDALKMLKEERPHLVLLDLMLPGIDGFAVCREIRRHPEWKGLPVLMLTAKSEDADMIAGLDQGADDYITKPFSPKLVSARVSACLRRNASEEGEAADERQEPVRLGELFIDPLRFQVEVAGEPVALTLTEFKILKLLAGRPGWVFTRPQIIDEVRGYEYSISPRTVDVHISSMRKKLGLAGEIIESVRGLGYRVRE